jgi:heme/copper-type cytochrome/quinol oxidase subunit 2
MEYCYEIYKRVRYQKMRKDEATVKKNKRIIIIIVAVAIIGLLIWWISSMNGIPKIKAEDVARIYYNGPPEYDEKDLDITEFLYYYDQIYDVEKTDGGVTTSTSWIVIELKDGKKINISSQIKGRFLVSYEKGDKPRYYWGSHEQIYNMLIHGSYEGEE